LGRMTQFHLPSPASDQQVKEAQLWRGTLCLAYSSSSPAACAAFAGLAAAQGAREVDGALLFNGPFGNRFSACLLDSDGQGRAGAGVTVDPLLSECGGEGFPVVAALQGVVRRCPKGSAEKVAKFYRRMFGFSASVQPFSFSPDEAGGESVGDRSVCTVVGSGPAAGQFLRFVEQEGEEEGEERDTGDHLCIYVEDLEACFLRCQAFGLACVNERFPHLDGQQASAASLTSFRQFRVRRVEGLCGDLLLWQEHEIRSTDHPSFPLKHKCI